MSKRIKIQTLFKDDKVGYRILRFLHNSDAISLMQTNSYLNEKISKNKALYKNLMKSTNKELSEIVFQRDNQFLLNNHQEIEKLIKTTDQIFNNFSEKADLIVKIWTICLIICLMDAFPLLMCLKAENYISSNIEHYFILIPLTVLCGLSIIFLCLIWIFEWRRGREVFRVINDNKDLNHRRESNLLDLTENINIRYKNVSYATFENLLLMVILIYIPIFIKFHFIQSMSHEETLMISGILLFGYSFLKIFYHFLLFKCKNWRSKIDLYKEITSKDTKFKADYEKYTKSLLESRSRCCNEGMLNLLFFISMGGLYFLFVWYFKTVGSKLDNTNSISWIKLFIPVYIIELPILAFVVVHGLAQRHGHVSKTETLLSGLVIFCIYNLITAGMLVDTILLPLRLDETIRLNYIVICVIPIFVSFLLFVHYRCVLR